MTEQTNIDNDDVVEMPTPLELLKAKAEKLGIRFHPNIGEPKLLAKVEAALAKDVPPANGVQTAIPEVDVVPTTPQLPVTKYVAEENEAAKAARLRKHSNKLVRVNVTCMNPNKKAMSGDYYTISNAVIGSVKKYVQYDTPDGWHVPQIIVDHLKNARCQIFVPSVTTTGKKIMKGKLINEYNVVELPALTEEEIKSLAERQALAGSID